MKPWERDWSQPEAAAQPKPWERDWSQAQPEPVSAEEQMAQAIQSGEQKVANPLQRGGAGILGTEAGTFTAEAKGEEKPVTREELAGRTGVDVSTGAPARVRFGASTSAGRGLFGGDPRINERNVAKLLADSYGTDVPVRTGPVSQELEYQNPETGQWTLVDEAGITGRDFADFAGDVPVVAGSIAGAAAGGAAGSLGGPLSLAAGTIGGEALGAGAGEYLRQKIGQWAYDTNEGVSEGQMIGSAAEIGALTGLLAPAGRLVGRVARQGKVRLTGETPEREVATLLQDPNTRAQIQQGLQETVALNRRLAEQEGNDAAAQVLAQLDQKLAAQGYDPRALSPQEAEALWANSQYKPTLADLSGDADLLADQSRLLADGPMTARPLRQQRQEGYSALQQGMEGASDVAPQAISKASLSRDIANEVTGRADRRVVAQQSRGNRLVDLARQRTEGAASQVDSLRQPLPENATVNRQALGQDIRDNVLQVERDRRKAEAQSLYDDLSTPDVEVQPANLRRTMESARSEAKLSKLTSQESGTISGANELLRNTQRQAAQGKGPGLRTQNDGVSSRFSAESLQRMSQGDRKVTIKNMSGDEAIATLKSLKAKIREIDQGQVTNADSAVFKRALSSLDEDMRAAFPDDFAAAKAVIDDQYRQMQDELERSLIGKITQQKAGKYVINDEFVFDRLVQPGNKTDAAVFKDMLHKPEYGGQRVALRDAFAEKYAKEVGKRSDYSRGAFQRKHQQFIDKYGDWMEGAFTPAEMQDIRNVGSAAAKLQRITQRQKEIERNVERILRTGEARARGEASNLVGKISDGGAVNPDAVFDRVWGSKEGMTKLRQLKGALEGSPALWDQFRSRAHYDLGQKVFDAATPRQGGADALDSFLRQNRDYLSETFGDQYVRDLSLVSQALKRSTARGRGREGSDKGMVLARAFSRVFLAPPLSARGRAQTAVERFIGSNHREEMAKLLADPQKLHRLATMKPVGGMTQQEYIARAIRQGLEVYGGVRAIEEN
ncbi:hypothetical protein DFO67_1321 [Modicisalibacter xianhensis]|uniref:Uncharacterized protein n=1 Tax=Modicisalibacter xianhensis TaxID=442341 RepID=A0A4R8F9J2_9GAMM|nr:hypothetical protein [Halomonas xianhensis]TDX21882.1 hypothetical protein DFO67_1321 [Halomonas xianhensis]